jgi:YHS domain-containing protein
VAKAIDPICHMDVDTDNPTGGKSEYRGSTYYFCAPGCKRTFDQDPGKYGTAQPQAAPQKGSLFSRLFGRKS